MLWLLDKGLGWSRDVAESNGAQFVSALTEIFWNLDGHIATFSGHPASPPRYCQGKNFRTKNTSLSRTQAFKKILL